LTCTIYIKLTIIIDHYERLSVSCLSFSKTSFSTIQVCFLPFIMIAKMIKKVTKLIFIGDPTMCTTSFRSVVSRDVNATIIFTMLITKMMKKLHQNHFHGWSNNVHTILLFCSIKRESGRHVIRIQ